GAGAARRAAHTPWPRRSQPPSLPRAARAPTRRGGTASERPGRGTNQGDRDACERWRTRGRARLAPATAPARRAPGAAPPGVRPPGPPCAGRAVPTPLPGGPGGCSRPRPETGRTRTAPAPRRRGAGAGPRHRPTAGATERNGPACPTADALDETD